MLSSIQITDRLFLGAISFQLQIQNRTARRVNFHCRDRSVGISAEYLSLQVQISLDISGYLAQPFAERSFPLRATFACNRRPCLNAQNAITLREGLAILSCDRTATGGSFPNDSGPLHRLNTSYTISAVPASTTMVQEPLLRWGVRL